MDSPTPTTPRERDPVCGMQVDPARAAALTAEHAGKRYYFCSLGCAAKFQANPDKYLAPKSATSAAQSVARCEHSATSATQIGSSVNIHLPDASRSAHRSSGGQRAAAVPYLRHGS